MCNENRPDKHFLPTVKQLEIQLNLKLGKFLGSGVYGQVWKLDNKRVFKITYDQYELDAVDKVYRVQQKGIKLPGVVKLYSAPFRLRSNSSRIAMGYIREYLPKKFKRSNKKIINVLLELGENYDQFFKEEDYLAAVKLLSNFEKTEHISISLKRLAGEKVYLTDIMPPNMGISNRGIVKIFDFQTAIQGGGI